MPVKAMALLAIVLAPALCRAQTEMDAIMMNRKQICNGFVYTHSSWQEYWEGTFKRTNENLGTVSTQSVMYMGAYGITDKLNVMAGLPYVWTKASAGTFTGLKGMQDVSVFIKWKPITKSFGKNKISLFTIGGISTPVTDYVVDFLPLSVGLGSTNLTARGIIDYQRGKLSVTGSAAYTWRSNVKLDRDSYYDTELRLTNEVKMPNAANYQLRAGYRGKYLLAEALLTNSTTLGGFDITKNNMPFPSNRMNATNVGVALKYTLPRMTALSLLAGGNYTVAGRNMGQSKSFNVGAFYAFYFGKEKKQ
jgi:hypothetical protein